MFRVYLVDTLLKNKTKSIIFSPKSFPIIPICRLAETFQMDLFLQQQPGSGRPLLSCMLSDKKWPVKPAFESAAFSSSANAVILVSRSIFRQCHSPAIKKSFPDGKFQVAVSNEKCTLKNSEKFEVKTSKGSIATTSFVLTESDGGNGLATEASGSGPLKFLFGLADLPDASYSWSCRTSNPLNFSNNKVTFLADKNPAITHDQTIKWYDWVLLVVVGITSLPGLVSVIVDSINNFSDQVAI